MWSLGIIKLEPLFDNPFGCKAVFKFVEINSFVFQATPQAFNEYVIHATPAPIHRETELTIFQPVSEVFDL